MLNLSNFLVFRYRRSGSVLYLSFLDISKSILLFFLAWSLVLQLINLKGKGILYQKWLQVRFQRLINKSILKLQYSQV